MHNSGLAGASRAALLAAALCLGACAQPINDPSTSGAVDTGAYPNLNLKPGVAANQISEGNRIAKTNELRSAGRSNASANGAAPNDEAYLRRIAATHDKDALREIQGDCPPGTDPACEQP